ncbi:polyprenyl synthetase family protein [Streptomyces sp. NPDC058049]|uniref:polyprenyl synthetase family protein n=1 Tax=Streptomyces sp. NPDC058049 TaxID=3346314 RepID=UPI0036E6768A
MRHFRTVHPDAPKSVSAYALPLGEAFQLRDDLLGVFGSPQITGKPALDDLREGKHTALVALTLQHASRTQADHLHHILGCPTLTEEQAEEARHIFTASGARHAVEEMITTRHEQALTALASAPLAPVAIQALTALAHTIVRRDS